MTTLLRSLLACTLASLMIPACVAQEALIRQKLAERVPHLPKIDEVSKTGIPGIYELRIGNDIKYTDERGDYVFEGSLFETKGLTNLTKARIDKLTAFDFASLPLKDAVVWKQGSGARKLVVFADPNCGYCKQLEEQMLQVKDVTVYTFLYPILGGDSPEKARDIWCAKDSGVVWRDWMIRGKPPARSIGSCDASALERNLALGKSHRIEGTPALVFEDNKRVTGAVPPNRSTNN